MAILEIKTFPDNILRKKAKPVTNIDGTVQEIIENMAETMYAAPGVGLAAVQVGIDQSIIVYDIAPKEEGPDLQVLINPRIVETEGTIMSENEGCLSLPDFRSDVKRAAQALAEGLDRDGNPVRIEADDILAVVLQHEIDHLNGVLLLDYVSTLKRGMYSRKAKKQRKRDA